MVTTSSRHPIVASARSVPTPPQEAGRAEQHWYLKNCGLLERLPQPVVRQLETGSRYRRFESGEVIYLPLDRADAVLVVVSGRVKLCHITPDGKQSILALIEPGEVFGELCLFDTTDREEHAVAMLPTALVLIPQELMYQLMSRQADLALGITRLLGLRRLRIERRLKSLLFRSSRDRLLQLLVELATDYGINTKLGVEIRIGLSHQDLASIIGSTRETVTTTLGELQEQELVTLGRRRITIRAIERLANLID